MAFTEISIDDIELNPFDKIGNQWALLTAGTAEASNTMTVSWGELGVLWFKNVITVFSRPQRYTKEFVDAQDRFTVSFYAPEHKRALGVLGSKSGRDTDKVGEVGFTPVELGGSIAYEEAELVFVCRKLYADTIKPECFIDESCDTDCYPNKDYHTFYVGEVEKVYVRA